MKHRHDGSIQSSATPTHDNTGRESDTALYRCMITRVIFVDDPNNITTNSQNSRVLYEAVVLGGFSSGQVIPNCRLSSILGGDFNFYERTLRAASKDVSKTRLSNNDGDVVYVQFIQGTTGYPVIIALDEGLNTGANTGAVAADGQVLRWQYNGIFTEIDKNGNFTWIRKGGTFDAAKQFFTPATVEEIKTKVESQKITITFKSGMTITLDGEADSATILTAGGAGIKVVSEKVSIGKSAIELLEQISQQLDKISTFMSGPGAGHDHLGNLGFPTAPPTQASDYSTLGSDLSDIKEKVDEIKGSF